MTTNFHGIEKEIRKIIKFYLVWVISLIWNAIIVYISSDIYKLDFHYSLLYIFLFNITFIFYLQRIFTFKTNEKKDIMKHFSKFVILVIFLLFIMQIFVPIVNNYVWSYWVSSFIILFFITILNYIVQNYLIFKK